MQLAGAVGDTDVPVAPLRCGVQQPTFITVDEIKTPKWRPVGMSSAGLTITGGFGGSASYSTESMEYVF